MKAKILLIEDEKGLIITLSDRLRSEGYDIDYAMDGDSGFEKALHHQYDLIILDLMLPKKSGLDICKDLRMKKNQTPVLMLTAKGALYDKVLGFKLGADDYLTKPFEMLELLSRIEALLRRIKKTFPAQLNCYKFGPFLVDFKKAVVFKNNSPVNMTAKEYKLLKYFIENQGEMITRDTLLDEVWGYNSAVSTRTVDVHVAWLRQKLGDSNDGTVYIETVHGLGYKFLGGKYDDVDK